MKSFLAFGVLFFCAFLSYGQDPCIPNMAGVNVYDVGNRYWKAYVYQLDPGYTGETDYARNFPSSSAAYKGMLPYRPGFLPHDTNHQRIYTHDFDINFGDNGGFSTDSSYFTTQRLYNTPNDEACPVQLQNFGVIFRTRIDIPETGIYKITIGSDDGSYLRHGTDIIHDNWGAGKTYNYNENIFNYYRPYTAGQQLYYDLSYFEKTGYNRVSFKFELYFGPGEIDGSQHVCGIAPDPAPFGSRGPAAFERGGAEDISYQWQYSLSNDTASVWHDIEENANGLKYDIPKYGTGGTDWTGTRYFRRMAILTIDGVSTSTPSNVVEATITIPKDIQEVNQGEFGVNQWIGDVYRGKGIFTDDNYAGRVFSDGSNLSHGFGADPANAATYPLDYGCSIVTTDFSVRYKMKFDVEPGTYTFTVAGDDGYRLFIDEEKVIDKWEGSPGTRTAEYFTDEAGQIELVLEYYEYRFDNYISFDHLFKILPLEWGKVYAEACGPDNCLTWETIQEKNTSHFELERSFNGVDWEMFDGSTQAQGNSTELHTYNYTDKRVMASKIYYRIKQVDMDEGYEYSEVMRVDNPYYVKSFLPYPNPTTDKIRIFSQTAVVAASLISNDYSVFRSTKPALLHDNRYEVDLVGLKPGNYLVVLQKEGGETETFKVIKK